MTNKLLIPAVCVLMGVILIGCSRVRRSPGRAYMPDMTYSRAYETYSSTEKLRAQNINFTAMPVEGTVSRSDTYFYQLKNDSAGYVQSATIKNPLDSSAIDKTEAERLYLVNCAICHGAKLDGNGPLFNGGNGPYQAAPKNFMADDMKKMPEGTMYHSVTYGKGQMGSYASQLNPQQRWMVVAYVKSKQGGGAAPSDTTGNTGAAITDTTGTK
jgi:mono/diheme cytochrome c family protein